MHLLVAAFLMNSIAPVQPAVPNRQPQLASAAGLTALVFGSGKTIWFAASHDNGHTFSPATEVARVPVLALGRHRGPRVVISGRTIVVSAVYGETVAAGPHAHGLPADGDLAAWTSKDGGHSWSKPVVINDVRRSAREGLHAIAAGRQGEFAAVWLDLRSPGTRLYGAYSKDDGVTWSKNVLLYASPGGTICQCCDPSIVFAGKNGFQIMFRDVLHGARDMYLANWTPGRRVSMPQKLGVGFWEINACPMDGGGLAHRGDTTLSAWRRDRTVYLDKPGQPEMRVGEGKDVALTLTADDAFVAWTTPEGIELYDAREKHASCVGPGGNFPALTSLSDGSVLLAWEQDGSIKLKIAD